MTTETRERALTPKQERYALLLFQGLSQREAYVKAGYANNPNLAIIDSQASHLASSYKVSTRLAELKAELASHAIADVTERKERLTKLLRANLVDFVDDNKEPTVSKDIPCHEAVKSYSVKTTYTKKGDPIITRSISLTDPIAAIAELNKMERIGTPDAVNITNDNRSVTIIVKSEEGKQALERLKTGKLPQLKVVE